VVCFSCDEKESHVPHPQLERVNASLKQRGRGAIWVSSEAVKNWTTDELTGQPGASPTYTDLGIETMATVQAIYCLAGRQRQAFSNSSLN